MRTHSIRRSKQILKKTYFLYRRKARHLQDSKKQELEERMRALQAALREGHRQEAHDAAESLLALAKVHLRKTAFEQLRDLVVGIGFALFVAILIRQLWFEFYEIPTGSMRPTLKEQDRLVVSKTSFGINMPLKPEHLYFDPALVERSSIFVFTGENMDIRDVDTRYFYLFPGKKQYVKRLMGKPGDTLYFYGGLLYGVDAEGRDISADLQQQALQKIDHVPFIHFEGKVKTTRSVDGVYSPVTLYQMNQPVAKLSYSPIGRVTGELLPPLKEVGAYSDLWGIGNYAMARLVTAGEAEATMPFDPEVLLYLELRHHPDLKGAKVAMDAYGRLRPMLGLTTSYLPLYRRHLEALANHLYTARFLVRGGKAVRYGSPLASALPYAPSLAGVPDGCYEFYYGKAYKILWQGIESPLPPTAPLYQFDRDRIQLLFNLGMEFDTRFSPGSPFPTLMPARFAFFRNGDLYLMGAPVIDASDPVLTRFVESERKKAHPFIDRGPPVTASGEIDLPFIKKYGLKIPEGCYLALGDNYAMSADSRDFGFVPASNLRGAPDFIFWPAGSRWGAPNQPPYPLLNLPRALVWTAALIALSGWYLYHRHRNLLLLRALGP